MVLYVSAATDTFAFLFSGVFVDLELCTYRKGQNGPFARQQ